MSIILTNILDKYEHCDRFYFIGLMMGLLVKMGCEPFKFNIDTSKISSCYE